MSSKGDPATRGDLDDLGTDLRDEMKTMGVELRDEMKTMGVELRDEMKTMGAELRSEMQTMGVELRSEMQTMGVELRSEMQTMGVELRGEMKTMGVELRGEMKTMGGELRDEIHWLGARFEQLDSKVSAFGEALMGLREHVTVEMRAMRAELGARIEAVERAVKDANTNIANLQVDVAELRKRFDRYEENSDLEKRVTAIEEQLGIAQKP